MKYETKLARNIKDDCHSFRYLKGKREAVVGIGLLDNEAGEVVMGNKEMVEELNMYFALDRRLLNKSRAHGVKDKEHLHFVTEVAQDELFILDPEMVAVQKNVTSPGMPDLVVDPPQ
eukprot:g34979.t1